MTKIYAIIKRYLFIEIINKDIPVLRGSGYPYLVNVKTNAN